MHVLFCLAQYVSSCATEKENPCLVLGREEGRGYAMFVEQPARFVMMHSEYVRLPVNTSLLLKRPK